jgi:hypothetical protein
MIIGGAAAAEGILCCVQQAVAFGMLHQPVGQHLVKQLADYIQQGDATVVAHAAWLARLEEVLDHACGPDLGQRSGPPHRCKQRHEQPRHVAAPILQ